MLYTFQRALANCIYINIKHEAVVKNVAVFVAATITVIISE